MKSRYSFIAALVAAAVVAILFAGCSSTGGHVTPAGKNSSVPKAVFLEPVPPDISSYSTPVISLLERNGFVFIPQPAPDCLRLRFLFNGNPWNLEVAVELLDAHQPLVTGMAVNPGWGNMIARSSSIANRAESAVENFKRQFAIWVQDVKLREPQVANNHESQNDAQKKEKRTAFGTGFFVTRDGKVLTAYHVINHVGTNIVIRLDDGTEFPARVDKVDPENDLAILKTGRVSGEFLELASTRKLSLGQPVFALGYPAPMLLGEHVKFTGGQISSLSGTADSQSLMQITTPIQPGNSGGPLFTEDGKVVGVITSQAAVRVFLRYTGSLPQNINWAVKSDYGQLLFDSPTDSPKLDKSNKSELAKAVVLIKMEID